MLSIWLQNSIMLLCTHVWSGSGGFTVKKTENVILISSDTELGGKIANLALALVCFYVVTLAFISKEYN